MSPRNSARQLVAVGLALLAVLAGAATASAAAPGFDYPTTYVATGHAEFGEAIDPHRRTVVLANDDGSVTLLREDTDQVLATIPNVTNDAGGVAVDPLTHTAYVTGKASGTVGRHQRGQRVRHTRH